jgi:hypothetical protein
VFVSVFDEAVLEVVAVVAGAESELDDVAGGFCVLLLDEEALPT